MTDTTSLEAILIETISKQSGTPAMYITGETRFDTLENWDSLEFALLEVQAEKIAADRFGVTISTDDFAVNSETVGEFINTVAVALAISIARHGAQTGDDPLPSQETEADPVARSTDQAMINSLVAGTSNAERATKLLQLPLAIIAKLAPDLCNACTAAGFKAGVSYVEAITRALYATRHPDGRVPDAIQATADGYTVLLQRYATGSVSEMMRMNGRFDARAGRPRNPDHEGDSDYEAGFLEATETTFTPER